jgi:hypothetical protein
LGQAFDKLKADHSTLAKEKLTIEKDRVYLDKELKKANGNAYSSFFILLHAK